MKQIVFGTTALCITAGSAFAATPTTGRDTGLRLELSAAVDSNCNGDLADETADNAHFSAEKVLEAGQCLVYRTDYSNDGDFAIRKVEVRTPVPPFMVYLSGTAEHVETPPGLRPAPPKPPAGGRNGDLVWPFVGGLGPGESGRVEFIVKLDPVNDRLDFVRRATD